MEIPENYEVLLVQGGASLQFSMIPMNIVKRWKKGRLCPNWFLVGKSIKRSQKGW